MSCKDLRTENKNRGFRFYGQKNQDYGQCAIKFLRQTAKPTLDILKWAFLLQLPRLKMINLRTQSNNVLG